MAVQEKNVSFAEEQKNLIGRNVKDSILNMQSLNKTEPPQIFTQTVTSQKEVPSTLLTSSASKQKRKDVLIGVHVTEEERNDLRTMFCAKGCSLAVAYRAAMNYLREDIAQGKATITNNGDVIRI